MHYTLCLSSQSTDELELILDGDKLIRVMTLKAPMGSTTSQEEREIPSPGAGEILVRVHASSLNYHDYLVARGMQQHSGAYY